MNTEQMSDQELQDMRAFLASVVTSNPGNDKAKADFQAVTTEITKRLNAGNWTLP